MTMYKKMPVNQACHCRVELTQLSGIDANLPERQYAQTCPTETAFLQGVTVQYS